jgi:hypothetical protein
MGVKFKMNLKVMELIEKAQTQFQADIKSIIPPEIIKTIEGGNNPVKAGKQVKYSDSYIQQITGKRTGSDGKSVAVKTRDTTKGANSALKYDKKGKSKSTGASSSLQSQYGKLKSPVNLKLTGELLRSIQTGYTETGIRVYFTDIKAEWHNNGVPEKNIPKRPLLPSNEGEAFNFNITRRIFNILKEAVKKAL